ncbi:hypothetical protein DTL42_10020 [Bremerella cremea]|uniref:Uncharacterized protein n=1 Tax=Bremerella cremea TaxID=1031537 RepID=A0A368KV13_9BACT|nr:hypothetical protein DTL42_10020 [Bremerella cremea]
MALGAGQLFLTAPLFRHDEFRIARGGDEYFPPSMSLSTSLVNKEAFPVDIAFLRRSDLIGE